MHAFASPRHERLTLHRFGADAIAFTAGRYETDDADEIAFLRSESATQHGVTEGDARAMKMISTPPPVAAAKVDLDAFQFDRRVYQRGNEPFVVLHVSPLLGPVADGVRALAAAFGEAFPTGAELRIVTSGARMDVGAPVVERELTDRALLGLYREAHVVVRTPSERDDAFAVKAVAAGTPVIDRDDLARALSEAEASYVRLSAQAAKDEKKLRAGR